MRGWLAIAAACVFVGCGTTAGPRTSIVVSAASSLTGAFTEMVRAFEEDNPGVAIQLNFAGSSTLREQILEGAGVDVFAAADLGNVEAALNSVEVRPGDGTAQPFALNALVVGLPADNPGGVVGIEDLAREQLFVGVCAVGVPCGDLAAGALAAASVDAAIDTFEPNVRAVVAKLEAGELDVGLIYVSDVSASTTLLGIAIADGSAAAHYFIAPLTGSDHASEFVKFVLSTDGQQILEAFGFMSP